MRRFSSRFRSQHLKPKLRQGDKDKIERIVEAVFPGYKRWQEDDRTRDTYKSPGELTKLDDEIDGFKFILSVIQPSFLDELYEREVANLRTFRQARAFSAQVAS